ncbi:hypothetical protein LINPERHAP2_LOCUS16862, partial [Linum perenne]
PFFFFAADSLEKALDSKGKAPDSRKSILIQPLSYSRLRSTYWWSLISKNRGTAPKGLKSWIHHFGGDTSFFKKFNPAQRKTLGLVKDFNPAQPNSITRE